LADDSEDELQIKEMLVYGGINLSIDEIHEIANEFLDQGDIY
jgi:hypothetical protein